jgi:hypothetical protein
VTRGSSGMDSRGLPGRQTCEVHRDAGWRELCHLRLHRRIIRRHKESDLRRPPYALWRRLVAASIRCPGGPVRWEHHRLPHASSTVIGLVPQRIGHDECPVGSRAFERPYRVDKRRGGSCVRDRKDPWLRCPSSGLPPLTGALRNIRSLSRCRRWCRGRTRIAA